VLVTRSDTPPAIPLPIVLAMRRRYVPHEFDIILSDIVFIELEFLSDFIFVFRRRFLIANGTPRGSLLIIHIPFEPNE